MTPAAVARLALTLGLLAPPAAVRAQAEADGAGAYLVVLASRLNVREAPRLDARVVTTAVRGDVLCVRRYDGDWAEVRVAAAPGGEAGASASGWVARGFVSETRASARRLEEVGCGGLSRRPGRDAGRSPSGSPRSGWP